MNAPSTSDHRQFGADYEEIFDLRNGGQVKLRCIRADDKDKLERGLAQASPRTRYLRFFTAKPRLSTAELAYFTEPDGEDHFAIVAAQWADGVEGEGAAVGRFVRLPDEPTVAEPAIVVLDAMQRQGLGRALMRRLARAAAERGVLCFRSEFLATNAGVRELFASVAPSIKYVADGATVTAEFPIVVRPSDEAPDDAAPTDPGTAMEHLLRHVAAQSVELRRHFAMLFEPDGLLRAIRKLRDGDDGDP